MWFHLELKGKGYAAARTGVAVADKPTGPFRFIRSERPNAGFLPTGMSAEQRAALDTLNAAHYPTWWTPQWRRAVNMGLFTKRDLQGGQMARDMQLFVDTDGRAYHIFASEENLTLHIAELSDDYLSHTGRYIRVAPGGLNEAPAIFRRGNTYWMITSGCTGWAPNEARMFSAPSIWGPWTQHPNPCQAPTPKNLCAQSTYVLPVAGKNDAFIFMADMWRLIIPLTAVICGCPSRSAPMAPRCSSGVKAGARMRSSAAEAVSSVNKQFAPASSRSIACDERANCFHEAASGRLTVRTGSM